VIWLVVIVFVMTWAGFWLLVDGLSRRGRRKGLAERLKPFQPTVGDEAEVWLRRQ
jgi:hypothetical protein